MAAEKGTKAAFLANMTDDALVFNPDKTNAKTLWASRGESQSLLSWAPNYADISANGLLGYTTGNWEYRPKGKDDQPAAFGEFITVWLRQADGRYKFVIDIGVGHSKPEKYSTEWTTSLLKTKDTNEKNSSASDAATGFYTAMAGKSVRKAYETFAADEVRSFREEKAPILGKKSLLSSVKNDKATYSLGKRSSFFGSADIAYNTSGYTRIVGGKIVEKGNAMQIWKLIGGRWRIVLDIFKPVP
jgi:ketosteroid isomerase-like protein